MYETLFKKIIEEKGLSYNLVSKMSGVPRSSIGNYANGLRKPDVIVAVKLLQCLQLDITIIDKLFEPVW